MKNVNKILFPTDFSETAQNAFRYCLVLADKLNASIQLLHVIYPEYEVMDIPLVAATATKDKIAAAKTVMKTFVDYGLTQVQVGEQLEHMPEVQSEVEIGNAVNTICRIAKRDEIDLIVMGTKGSHNALERTFGSVTTGVIRKAPAHTWVVPERALYQGIHILAYATDLNEADPVHIMEVGKLFDPFCSILHCVHVNTEHSIEKLLDLANLEATFSNNSPVVQIKFHQIPGDSVVEGLEDFVDYHNVDVLVMYAPHHDLLESIFHRSFTREMALETEIPLLVLKEKS